MVSLTAWATSALLMVPVFMYAATIKKQDGESDTCNIYWPWEDSDVGNDTSLGGGNDTSLLYDDADDFAAAVADGEEGKWRRRRHHQSLSLNALHRDTVHRIYQFGGSRSKKVRLSNCEAG